MDRVEYTVSTVFFSEFIFVHLQALKPMWYVHLRSTNFYDLFSRVWGISLDPEHRTASTTTVWHHDHAGTPGLVDRVTITSQIYMVHPGCCLLSCRLFGHIIRIKLSFTEAPSSLTEVF
jgi:hypothetical protein